MRRCGFLHLVIHIPDVICGFHVVRIRRGRRGRHDFRTMLCSARAQECVSCGETTRHYMLHRLLQIPRTLTNTEHSESDSLSVRQAERQDKCTPFFFDPQSVDDSDYPGPGQDAASQPRRAENDVGRGKSRQWWYLRHEIAATTSRLTASMGFSSRHVSPFLASFLGCRSHDKYRRKAGRKLGKYERLLRHLSAVGHLPCSNINTRKRIRHEPHYPI